MKTYIYKTCMMGNYSMSTTGTKKSTVSPTDLIRNETDVNNEGYS